MAQMTEITLRAAYTAQALATLGVDPAWDATLSEYLRLWGLENADHAFGMMGVARENSEWAAIKLKEKYGAKWRANADATALWKPEFDKSQLAEDTFYETYSKPYWEAARRVMRTPAPTLAAALFKIQLIEIEEIDREEAIDGRCMAFVIDDMARIAGGQV